VATVTTAQSESSVGSFRGQPEQAMSFTTMMVHLDVERDCEQRVQLALALADRFQAALIGVAGLAMQPAFAAGGVVVYCQPTEHECHAASARLEDMGKKFRAQGRMSSCRASPERRISSSPEHGILGRAGPCW